MHFHLSMNFIAQDYDKVAQKDSADLSSFHAYIISFLTNKLLLILACNYCKQKLDADKNNPRISSATVTNFQLTLA